eukprot:614704-Prymnesium_polylepis.1
MQQSFLINGISTPTARFAITFGTDFELNYDEHRRAGLSNATAQTFLDFAERLETLAAACPQSCRKEPLVLVSTITDAVHDLGAEVRTEVRGALRAAGC